MASEPFSEELAGARAVVSHRLSEGDLPGAADAYLDLVARFGSQARAALLSARTHLDLANHFFQTGRHQAAAAAYEVFLDGYPRHREAPSIRLMLALIVGRYLHDAARARGLIAQVVPALSGDQAALARDLLAELDARAGPGVAGGPPTAA